ncbi:MAG: DNA methyltransferase, partial [Thermoproteota archaeon]|nr:DNA methyltransferase [Thermoproteota archaeon]
AKKIIEHGLNKRQTEIFLKLYDEMPDADLNDLALQAKQVKHVMKLIPTGEAKEEIKKALERAGKPKPISEEVKKKISEARKKTEEIKRLAREKRAEEKIIPVKESSLPIITPFKLRREEKRVQKPLVEAPKLVEKPAIPADVKRAVRERPELKDYVEELSRIKDPEKRKRMIKATSKSLEAVKNQVRKRLERFPEKSKMMQPKFARLEELQNKGIILHTIWDFRYRDDYAGYRDFVSNCSPQLIEQCILRLTEEGDLVVDPMVGSGTTIDVCRVFNRRCIGYDIKPVRPDIIQEDARKLPLESDYADMIFIHPPYWKLTTYTKAEENLPDLSRAKTFEGFLGMLREVFKECYRVLKHTKYMCVLLGDLVREGKYVPICRKAANLAEEIGFDDCGYAVKIAHGEISRKKSGVIFAELAYTNYLKVCHDLIMFFRKP